MSALKKARLTLPGTNSFSFEVKGQSGTIPCIGLGTAGLKGESCFNSVTKALELGYRHIDTALLYNNQEQVGAAIKASSVPRDEIFLTSKVAFFPQGDPSIWMYANELAGKPNFNGEINHKGNEDRSIKFALGQLMVDNVDLLLIHNPCVTPLEYSAACLPHFFELFYFQENISAVKPAVLPDGTKLRNLILTAKTRKAHDEFKEQGVAQKAFDIRKASWKALENAKRTGQAKYIGVSNYTPELLEEMEQYAEIMPAVNQLELHPKYASPKLQEVAKRLGVVLTGYGQGHYVGIDNNDIVNTLAVNHAKSSIQIVLRWMTQLGIVAVPRSHNPQHMAENLNIFDFELSDEEVELISTLNENHPFYWNPEPSQASSL
eukprot:m.164091 g.164091  ORF g.164091 m.164091 type:complete len:376 (+) comp31321_c0_seq1:92-1219(+)